MKTPNASLLTAFIPGNFSKFCKPILTGAISAVVIVMQAIAALFAFSRQIQFLNSNLPDAALLLQQESLPALAHCQMTFASPR